MESFELLPTVWVMFTATGFYPIQPSNLCTPEAHAELNDHITRIEDAQGRVLWRRALQ